MKKIVAISIFMFFGLAMFAQTNVRFVQLPTGVTSSNQVEIKAQWYYSTPGYYDLTYASGTAGDLLAAGITVNFPSGVTANDIHVMLIYVAFLDNNGNNIIIYLYKDPYVPYIVGPYFGNWSIL